MNRLKFTKRIITTLCFILVMVISSCSKPTPGGTLHRLDEADSTNIEVYKYYYSTGNYVYVARFKDTPNTVTTTWTERRGKLLITQGNVTIFENDSIQVILKK